MNSRQFSVTPIAHLLLMLLVGSIVLASGAQPSRAAGTSSATFLNQQTNTASASLQIDSAGGLHAAYVSDPQEQAYYSTCAPLADCANRASWTQTHFGSHVREVQLELTPQGQPRMLLLINDPDDGDPDINDTWWYAACQSSCTNSASWSMIFIGGHADIDVESFYTSNHYFALDPQGRPRVVFGPKFGFDPNTFEVFGWMVYASCNTACTADDGVDPAGRPTSANWSYGRIDAVFHQPALAFTSDGRPRIAAFADADDGQGSDVLEYFACDSDCGDSASWAATRIGEPGASSESVALRLDSHDRPRMAVFFQGAHSRYLWCNSACTDGAQWGSAPIDPNHTDGGDPDLQLDQLDRPRIAFHWQAAPDDLQGQLGVGYAWCDTNCESPGALFQRRLAEDSPQLDADWPLPRPINCPYANWLGGYRPSLALDAAGQPRIAADADFVAFGCVGVPEPGHGLPIDSEKTHTAVRLILAAPAIDTSRYRVLLPLAQR
jgi:hypothetical protein